VERQHRHTRAVTAHGTRARYVHDRCRCDACTHANREYRREWARSKARPDGHRTRQLPATSAEQVLRSLERKGCSTRAIADAAGVARSTVTAVRAGTNRNINIRTFRALLDADPLPRRVDARPLAAALAALRQAGYPSTAVAAMAGLERVRVRHGKVRADVATAVLTVFARLGGRVEDDGTVTEHPLPAAQHLHLELRRQRIGAILSR
jgi:transcriptional regulator with XRE-family HTH domain